ncbi:MAG TPA: PEP-CTERM sorting domain-containing protein [Bryobacteraceae bacterium]|nr:PEP-CTERM sorting domain-containing protein [Bryobacteraceae bacterium]
MKFKIPGMPLILWVTLALIPARGVTITSPLAATGSAQSFCAESPKQFLDALPLDLSTGQWNTSITQVGDIVTSPAACGPLSSSVTARAFAGISDVSGGVSITASPELGSNGGVGTAATQYESIVTLQPPPGSTGSGVTFGIAATYDLELGFTDNTIIAVATVGLSVPDFNQNVSTPYIAPPLPSGVGSVSYTGLLQTGDMTFLSCPCSTSFTLEGAAEASGGNGTYASFADPVSFILPPGWTYTLAFPPPQPAEVPEPSSGRLALIGLGLLAMGAVRRTAVRGWHRSP